MLAFDFLIILQSAEREIRAYVPVLSPLFHTVQ